MESPEELISVLEGYVRKLREESLNQQKQKLTDDATTVRLFCQTVELILRHSLKERLTFWGERRDYWGYLCEGCAGNKELDPIIRQIQSSTLVTTNQGKGRAFIRRCLSEHLLAECIQTTVNNVKKTREWYVSGAVLLMPQLSQQIVVALYDVGEVDFLLPMDGLDLDNTWPSFAIKSFQSPQHRLPLNVTSPLPQTIPTLTRTPSSAIPPPKAEVTSPLQYPTKPSPLHPSRLHPSPVEQPVECSGESTSSDSGQSSDHPVATSPSGAHRFITSGQLPPATPSAPTVSMPTDAVRPASTTPSTTPSPPLPTYTNGVVEQLSGVELSDRPVLEEVVDGDSPVKGVVTSSDWEAIADLLGAIQGIVRRHDDGDGGGGVTPPPGHVQLASDVVTVLLSLRQHLEQLLPSTASRNLDLMKEVERLKGQVTELEERHRESVAMLERSRDVETRLREASEVQSQQAVVCEQLRDENTRLRGRLRVELEDARAMIPVQPDVTTDIPAFSAPSRPESDRSGDLAANLASLQAEHGQCAASLESSQREAASLRQGVHQLEQEMALLKQEHQRAMRTQDAQHQNAYTLLREKMNEQLMGEKKGRKMAEEERDQASERLRSLKEECTLETSSLKYQLSSQLMAQEQSKEAYSKADKQLLDLKTSNFSLEKQVAELGAQATSLQKGLAAKSKECELFQMVATNSKAELKATREELMSLQMERTVTRDKERVELLRFQTELDATKKQLLAEKKESSRLARENEEIRKMFAKLLEQKASLWQLADQLENEHTSSEWVDSDHVNSCMACKEEFSLLNRKHHCRSCGKVFCNNCCSKKVMLASNKEPVRACNACYKKQLNKTSRASEVINTLEESLISSSLHTTNGTVPPPSITSQLIQAPPPPLIPIQHGHSTNSLQQILLTQNSDGHLSSEGPITPLRTSDSFIPDQLSSGPSSYTVHHIGRNGRDAPNKSVAEEVGTKEREGRREEAVPRSFDEKTATPKRFDDVVAKRPMDGVTEDSRERAGTSGGGGSRAGKAGVVAYSLEDYDGLTKDDSYVVIETQSSGSMFPLGLDSNQGQLDVNALATKLASLEAADRDGGHSVPPSRSLSSTSSDFKEVALEGGACHKVTITVDTIGTVVGWEFCTEPKGVAFGITYCRDDRQEEVLPLRRCTSHKATLTGEYVVQKCGKYILNFDNCHSKYSGRQLRYKIWQTPPI